VRPASIRSLRCVGNKEGTCDAWLQLLSFVVALCPAESKGTAEDEIAIRKVLSDVTEAFNRHEGKLTPTAYSDDYDAVILNGVRIPRQTGYAGAALRRLRSTRGLRPRWRPRDLSVSSKSAPTVRAGCQEMIEQKKTAKVANQSELCAALPGIAKGYTRAAWR
jgi:hypothetical protein